MKTAKTARRKRSKLSTINLVSIIFFLLVAGFFMATDKYPFLRAQQGGDLVQVATVHDGDTVSVIIDGKQEKVRLIGIDAPEMGQNPWGGEAKRHLESIIGSSARKVRIEHDVEKKDQHGRILAYLWTTDNGLINLMMIRSGQAVLYTVPPNVKYAEEFRKAQAEARDSGRGIWSDNGLREKPRDYRKENPGT